MSSIEHCEKIDPIFKHGGSVMGIWLVGNFLLRAAQHSRTTSVIKQIRQKQSAS